MTTKETAELSATNPATVLVAEDEKAMASLLREILQKNGYRVLIAGDGEEAIELYHRHRQGIDVVLMDIGLPKVSGVDAVLKMKQEDANANIVIASGYIEPEIKAKMYQAGVRNFVYKPYAIRDILKTLESSIARS